MARDSGGPPRAVRRGRTAGRHRGLTANGPATPSVDGPAAPSGGGRPGRGVTAREARQHRGLTVGRFPLGDVGRQRATSLPGADFADGPLHGNGGALMRGAVVSPVRPFFAEREVHGGALGESAGEGRDEVGRSAVSQKLRPFRRGEWDNSAALPRPRNALSGGGGKRDDAGGLARRVPAIPTTALSDRVVLAVTWAGIVGTHRTQDQTRGCLMSPILSPA